MQTESKMNPRLKNESTFPLQDCFMRDGVVGPISVLTEQEAAKCLAKFESWAEFFCDDKCRLNRDFRFKPHLYLGFVNQIIRHPKLITAVSEVLKTDDIICWSSQFCIKGPNSEGIFCPHQDVIYSGLEPANQCVKAWIALSNPISEKEGCLSFYKGTHKLGQVRHKESKHVPKNNVLSRGQRVAKLPAGIVPQPMHLRGGEASLHSFLTIHESGPNISSEPVVGLEICYIDASVQQTGKDMETVTIICGKKERNDFDLEPVLPDKPTENDCRKGKDAHLEAIRRGTANYLHGILDEIAYNDVVVAQDEAQCCRNSKT